MFLIERFVYKFHVGVTTASVLNCIRMKIGYEVKPYFDFIALQYMSREFEVLFFRTK